MLVKDLCSSRPSYLVMRSYWVSQDDGLDVEMPVLGQRLGNDKGQPPTYY